MTKIKICGITNLTDALICAELGVDYIGFIFAPSPRMVEPRQIEKIVTGLPGSVKKVGVFVNEKPSVLNQIANGLDLDLVQLSGSEDKNYLNAVGLPFIKVFPVKDSSVLDQIQGLEQRIFMLDNFSESIGGGTGNIFCWEFAISAKRFGQVFLSGGLNPQNVKEALMMVRPFGVDVCSGVEAFPGVKDRIKLKKFVEKVRRWDSPID